MEGFFLSFLPWSLFATAGYYHTQPTSEPKSWSIEPCLIRSKSFISEHLGPHRGQTVADRVATSCFLDTANMEIGVEA